MHVRQPLPNRFPRVFDKVSRSPFRSASPDSTLPAYTTVCARTASVLSSSVAWTRMPLFSAVERLATWPLITRILGEALPLS